ncbi:uncharacterized protein LOC141845555 [Curcuma longa]|uniref:uncharacterized protein LOC141845555 n=1 Tax=Curcuma longa TaxID=136217 RepID=UPI003D9DE9BE
MESSGDLKRRREESEEEMPSPGAKRLREDLLFDDDEGEDVVAGEQDIASVMKSLEEEIALPAEQPDLGFLLEASDDELGLPPPPAASSSSSDEAAAAPAAEAEAVGFGQMWELADDLDAYYAMGEFVGVRAEERPADEATGFDLFDFADSLWPSESLLAI